MLVCKMVGLYVGQTAVVSKEVCWSYGWGR